MPPENVTPKSRATINRTSDYAMHHFTMTIMNHNGRPARIISGRDMMHYPDHDRTEIMTPHATFIQQGKTNWVVTANKADTQGNSHIILLTGQVIVTQENRSDIQLRTQQLTIDTIHNTAYTDLPVTLISPNGITHAVGLHAALNDRTINLHSKVKGRYDAPPVD